MFLLVFSNGIDFGLQASVKMNFKYLLLVLGVLVALIIAITSFNDTEKETGANTGSKASEQKMNLSVFEFKIRKAF